MAAAAQPRPPSSTRTGFWSRYVAPPSPAQANPVWHVSPFIDAAMYHFSWAWVLVPMLIAASDNFYLIVYSVMMGANLAHRHFGLPYAYLDRGVFRSYRSQLTWFPAFCLAMLAATPLLLSRHSPAAGLVVAIAAFAAAWNLWHTFMQKFGIMRLYAAKDPAPLDRKTPAWIDKYLLLCWFPLYFTYVGPHNSDLILANTEHLTAFAAAILSFFDRNEFWLVPPALLTAAGGVMLWLWCEWRSTRFANRARLSAAVGTTLIATAPLWANPIKAVIAFAFSHAVEYMVFVWAFQRRRYSGPQPDAALMRRLTQHPRTWYFTFVALFGVAGAVDASWSSGLVSAPLAITFLGMTGASWFFYYAVYESLVHFYMDGFLWKMRRADVRASI